MKNIYKIFSKSEILMSKLMLMTKIKVFIGEYLWNIPFEQYSIWKFIGFITKILEISDSHQNLLDSAARSDRQP